jgi:EpsI family protein
MLKRFSWHFASILVLLAGTLTASIQTAHRRSESLARPLNFLSRTIAGFQGSDDPPLDAHSLNALKSSSYLLRTYKRGNMPANLFVAYYEQQRAGESMHSPKHCLPGSGWEIWNTGNTVVPVNGKEFTINKYSISHEGQRRLVLYWYQSKTRIIASEYAGKILLARDTLLQNSTAAAIVRVVLPDEPGALEQGREFVEALIPEMQRCFGT